MPAFRRAKTPRPTGRRIAEAPREQAPGEVGGTVATRVEALPTLPAQGGRRRSAPTPPAPSAPPRRIARVFGTLTWVLVGLVWTASLVLATAPLAAAHGTRLWDPWLARLGATVASWLAVMLITRRIGGPSPLVALFAGASAAALVVLPRGWVLSAGAVAAAASYGLLAMVMSRPARGVRIVREAVLVALIGAAGAVVVTGYDVALRPYRFRMLVLGLTLLAALALAWRLGLGFSSLGRRGLVLIVGAVCVLVLAVVYVQAVRHWGSSEVVGSLRRNQERIKDWLGAAPRTIEALVGFPALVWGVAVRSRRRQGWWMSAFGSLAAAGIATSLVRPTVSLARVAESTGYNLVIGCALGLVLVTIDRLLTGTGRRSRSPEAAGIVGRPEPGRLSPLL